MSIIWNSFHVSLLLMFSKYKKKLFFLAENDTTIVHLALDTLNAQQASTNIESVRNIRAAILAMVVILMAKVNTDIFSAETSRVIQRLQDFNLLSMLPRKGQV